MHKDLNKIVTVIQNDKDLLAKEKKELTNIIENSITELKTETALEIVRAKTMAMKKSEELKDVIKKVYEQFLYLNINLDHAGFVVDYQPKGDWHFWIADKQEIPSKITTPYFDSVWALQFEEAKEKGQGFFVTNLNFEEKNKFYQVLLNLIPDLPKEVKEFYFSCPGLAGSTVLLDNVGLYIENFEGIPYTKEENKTLMRFGKVFQQSYTRFLDLQKAESQAREAQIELGLEKVRARGMAMHTTSELQEVIHIVHQELLNLNIGINGGSFIAINSEIDKELHCWGSGGTANTSEEVHVPRFDKPFYTNLLKGIKKGPGFFTEEYKQKEKKEFFTHLFKHEPWSMLDDREKKEILTSPGGYTRSCCVSQHTSIFIINHLGEKFSEDENGILKRFTKVFEQTYTRFLDLQKAEAQARESQIELGLERVRARAMAMQHSNELSDLVATVLDELTKLDFSLTWCIINIINEADNSNMIWAINPEGGTEPESYYMKFEDYPYHHATIKAWKAKKTKFVYILEGKEKKIYDDYLYNETEFKKFSNKAKKANRALDRYVASFTFSNFGGLQTISSEPLSEENLDILARFGKVFDMTYTRFNDLQKAEAQAREAQIEAALEKVRSRTMAMQRSDELPEAANTLFLEVQALDIPAWSCGYNILSEDKKSSICNMSSEGELQDSFVLPLTQHKSLKPWHKAIKNEEGFFVYGQKGKNLVEHYNYMESLPELKGTFELFEKAGINLPTQQFNHLVRFNEGFLLFITYEEVPEAHDIFKRFGKVFEQTYTRFLDLQKAEAQVREARIEAALERVRSRSMAMHKSEELLDVISVVSEQLLQLEFKFMHVSFANNDISQDYKFWTASKGMSKPMRFNTPYLDIAMFNNLREAQEKSVSFYTDILTKEEHTQWHQHLLKHGGSHVFSKAENEFIMSRGMARSIAINPNIMLILANYASIPYSEEDNKIILRFGQVFEQSYTRFLDLQKAEAQAKESQIQLALERVRARTMAMQKSEELQETALLLFQQVQELGIPPFACGFNIWDSDKKAATAWMGSVHGLQPSFKTDSSKDIYLPIYKASQRGESIFVKEQGGQELKDHYAYLSSIPIFKNIIMENMKQKGITFPTFQIIHCTFFSQGYLMFISYEPVPEAYDIFKRFAKVFEQTYIRFNDLKQAEQLAKQAQIDLENLKAAKKKTEDALVELKATQSQLIQAEKMASLGELTAGIAHEIQNPLNFVNNFSEVSNELIQEIQEERGKAQEERDEELVSEILDDIKQNLQKINHHGKRADGIVKGMLQHSRSSSGIKEPTDINKLADEYLRLAYHGLRAKDKLFNATMKTDFDESIGKINIIPQDMGRVILNLITNAFYAVTEKKTLQQAQGDNSYEPTVSVNTKKEGNKILIAVIDNGNGIPQKVVDKIFQPFFTTKPTGQGTGLGLSLSYDIVKTHNGELKVETKEGSGTKFKIILSF
tara:strand:- start:4812 stop:9176 length:4365 start_codon:yes stop_codon:yes gene_type:complete